MQTIQSLVDQLTFSADAVLTEGADEHQIPDCAEKSLATLCGHFQNEAKKKAGSRIKCDENTKHYQKLFVE